ncbi:response regulator [Clostridiaceae bacterium UIB06]|uniref:Response regulator n=1 Tax=Clostridium thailandense TaxID=2794346 RepID=A0A949TPT4_9CLOT|nr:response regulator [Clostridium thailandense]MBV7273177.1 response regulator [Clostridium thailandense]MCH5136034.1 response regulator [Clostridiaceae bacterium UIB06]
MYNIVHLEQSEFIKKMVKHTLLENGFNCVSVDTASEVYNILSNDNQQIDLIITSLLITDDTIENFMRTINASSKKHVPVFVVTGNDIGESKKRVLNLGVSDYITKDCLVDELIKHIQYILADDELMRCLQEAKIAVIDDNNFDRTLIKDTLAEYKIFNIDFYSSGNALIESGKKYDLYLVDIVLEGEFGKNIILRLRRDNIDSSIIVVSSLTNNKTLASMLNAGANDYIRKPIQEDIFIAKLKSNIRTYSLIKKIKDQYKSL